MRAPKTAAKVSRFASDATNTSSAPGRSRVSAGLPKDSGIASDPASLLSSGPKTGRTISETGPTSAGPDTRGQYQEYYGIDIDTPGEAAHLQRLEQSNTLETVRGWADEGMPVEAMGTPSKMQAFRKRKGTPVPWDIEQRNEASKRRNTSAVQRATRESPAGQTQVPNSVRDVVSAPGKPVDAALRKPVESEIGQSLDHARVHRSPAADAACDQLNARAFTVNNHVAVRSDQPSPDTPAGQHLMSHELTHVAQQTGGAVSLLPDTGALEVDPDPQLEQEAEETAQRVMSGGELGIQRAKDTDIHVQRMRDAEIEGDAEQHIELAERQDSYVTASAESFSGRNNSQKDPKDVLVEVLSKWGGTVNTLDELAEKLRQGGDASQYIPAINLPQVERETPEEREAAAKGKQVPNRSLQAAEKYAAQLGIKKEQDNKTGETITRVNGKKIILKPVPIPEKRKEWSAKDKSDIAAHKAAYARNKASNSTGVKKLFKNLAADWHDSQHEKYKHKSERYKHEEEAKQAADARAIANAASAKERAKIITAEAKETQDPNKNKAAKAAKQIAAQAQDAERNPKSMGGKVDRAKQKVSDIERDLQAINDWPVQISDTEVWQYKMREAQRGRPPKFDFSRFGNKGAEYKQREEEYVERYVEIYDELLKSPETKVKQAELNRLKDKIIHIRTKRKSLIAGKLKAAEIDADHPYGPDQGSKLARIIPTINNRERAFAGLDMDKTAWRGKTQSRFRGERDIRRSQVHKQAYTMLAGGLLGGGSG